MYYEIKKNDIDFLLSYYHTEGFLNKNFNSCLYKQSVLNGDKEKINVLIRNNIDSLDCLKSKTFINIGNGGSLIH